MLLKKPEKVNKFLGIETKKIVVGSLSTNCYLIIDKKTKETIILDPGDDADYIVRIINDKNLTPVKIILTHGHYDHMLAAFELKNILQIPLLASKKDQLILKRVPESALHFSNIKNVFIPQIDSDLDEISKISLGKNILKIIKTPGHTPGGICLFSKKEKIIFVGDLIFNNGSVGRTDFFYSNTKVLKKSVNKIIELPSDILVYSGHGPVFNLGVFKKQYLQE